MHDLVNAFVDTILPVFLFAPLSVVILIAYVRLLGLRSFSKMTSFDFAITVATGSLLANAVVASDWITYFQYITAIGVIFLVQYLLAKSRVLSPSFRSAISNEPIVLFSDGTFNDTAMEEARVAEEDIWAKVREANALQVSNIQAVVLETTGDISVLHGESLDPKLIKGVRQTA